MIFLTKDRVLVKLRPSDERSKTGRIIIPKESRQDSFLADVCAVGPYQDNVKVGDTVVISNVAGIEIPWNGEKYIILDNRELLAIYDDGFDTSHCGSGHVFELRNTVKHYECCCGAVRRIIE
jgi:co-chaperonin GroES (HSP10)